ncbi:glycosyltransferase [Alphaproteobacteria bacterium]|nr:glycosyltransferase [Alphaproteobacteria bacterium]
MLTKRNLSKCPIVYVTIDDICSGLFTSQVLPALIKCAQLDAGRTFQVLVVNRLWKIHDHRRRLNIIHKTILPNNLSIRYIPLLPPLRKSAGSKLYSKFVTNYLSLLVRIFLGRTKVIVHARSYWPCAASLQAGAKAVIFEPRSLWTLENVAMGDIREGSSAEVYWNDLEKVCVLKSERVVSINTAMADYFCERYNSKRKNEVIPISFSDQLFFYNEKKRDEIRSDLSLVNKRVFVYSGSFGMSQIGLKCITNTVRMIHSSVDDAHFLFLTPSHEELAVSTVVDQAGLSDRSFTSIHPTFDQITDYLSAADFGYHALPSQQDSFTRMGTKIVEYFAAGLPVIVNRHVGAAAKILEENSYGFVIDEDMPSEVILKKLSSLSKLKRLEIAQASRERYEVAIVAKSYLQIYRELDVLKDGAAVQ